MTKDEFIQTALYHLPEIDDKDELDRVKLDLEWRYKNEWTIFDAVSFINIIEGNGFYGKMTDDEKSNAMNELTQKYGMSHAYPRRIQCIYRRHE